MVSKNLTAEKKTHPAPKNSAFSEQWIIPNPPLADETEGAVASLQPQIPMRLAEMHCRENRAGLP